MAEVRGELTAAEDNVQKFLINNRDFKDSPVLDLEHDRLQREVAVLQDVYTAVRNQYEQARQSEVRNTPEITLVESPIFPARPDRRHLLVKGLLALLAGVWLAIITIASLEFMDRRRRENSAEVQDLEELARASMVDARRIGSVFRWRRKKTA